MHPFGQWPGVLVLEDPVLDREGGGKPEVLHQARECFGEQIQLRASMQIAGQTPDAGCRDGEPANISP
jgi:hypothetical protein